MAEYTQAIDAHISQTLRLRGYVTPDMLAGLDHDDAVVALRHYADLHSSEVPFVFDGERLTWAERTVSADEHAGSAARQVPPAQGAASTASPVDQVMRAPQGRSLLDVDTSGGPYSKWLWWLPFLFGVVGGVISWLIVRDVNRRAGRQMIIAGLVVTIVTTCMTVGLGGGILGSVRSLGSSSSAWPPSPTGQGTFYYFGTST